MSDATIAGRPVEDWERMMDAEARYLQERCGDGGDIAGVMIDRWDDDGTPIGYVRGGWIPNDMRGINHDGTRITSSALVRQGHYGPWPGKWGKG